MYSTDIIFRFIRTRQETNGMPFHFTMFNFSPCMYMQELTLVSLSLFLYPSLSIYIYNYCCHVYACVPAESEHV